jgi:hypothetical protein
MGASKVKASDKKCVNEMLRKKIIPFMWKKIHNHRDISDMNYMAAVG